MQTKAHNDTILAATYARQCYGQDAALNKLRCSMYTKRSIAWTASEVDYPFAGSICSAPLALQLDSEIIDSHMDLGMNTPDSARVGFRKVTTCSPLKVTPEYGSVVTSTGTDRLGVEDDRIREYQYGTYSSTGLGKNVTYMYNQHAYIDGFGYDSCNRSVPRIGFLGVHPQLVQTSADLTLIFLAPNAIKYSYPDNTPFFSANYYADLGSFNGVNLSYCSADEYVNTKACQDQYQYCNGESLDRCTRLTAYQQAYAAIFNSTTLDFNAVQESVAARIILNTRTLSMYHSIGGRGVQALRVSETIQERNQMVHIPHSQWQAAVASWLGVSMARLQRSAVEYAAPSLRKSEYPAGAHPGKLDTPISRAMCYSQKVGLVGDTISFSVLGLVIILTVGSAAILLYLVLELCVAWFRHRQDGGSYRRVRWVMDEKMQVQRMMFEEAGMGGTWTNLAGAVPVTQTKEVFAALRHVDPAHPRLGRQWTRLGEGDGRAQQQVYLIDKTAGAQQPTGNANPYVSPIGEYIPVLGTATAVPMPTTPPYPSDKHGGGGQQTSQVYQKQVYHALTPRGALSRGKFRWQWQWQCDRASERLLRGLLVLHCARCWCKPEAFGS
ncbi:uncharacterized protein A1O9_04978 [Exophiala aquamarina CBS 119918]|uniref:Uncharacterized protein n=1 Tax=Exophiala aquamarina CBS 119918 TaxID=1182545 RepID=A0A072PLA0_9EURO|nr:uncharacterized protein A1O9_04978 [Exophiala aquamarina CBS 119918]KEF60128.1 hypothetical protein A1O9_04978 [Exophiala aquamarina CBS 119918]